MDKKEKYRRFKGKEIKEIKEGVDNLWEFLTVLWLSKNKECKAYIIKALVFLLMAIIVYPSLANYLHNFFIMLWNKSIGAIL